MKKLINLIFSLGAIGLSGVVVYHVLQTGCQAGVEYSISSVPEEFNLDKDTAARVAEKAASIWNGQISKEVIVYNPDSDFEINFIYDERQAETINRQSSQESLEESKNKIEALVVNLEEARNNLEIARGKYSANKTKYEDAQANYNDNVRQYNNNPKGDITLSELEDERQALEALYEKLEQERQALNRETARVNKLAASTNGEVSSFNINVRQYNSDYGSNDNDTFKQGIYDGYGIEVYQYENESDLLALLVHEFGHALGMEHVDDEDSVMYYLKHNAKGDQIKLTESDLEELDQVCYQSPLSINGINRWWEKVSD